VGGVDGWVGGWVEGGGVQNSRAWHVSESIAECMLHTRKSFKLAAAADTNLHRLHFDPGSSSVNTVLTGHPSSSCLRQC
jgi:hypothetical protein